MVVSILMLAVDQAVKAWVRGAIPPNGSLSGLPLPGIFEITLIYNEGIAYGMAQGSAIYMTPIAVVIAIGAGVYSFRHPNDGLVSHLAMALLASGAIGNLYDRLVYKKVTDMFWFRAIDFPVFNVADACITVATILLILTWMLEAGREKAKATPAQVEDAG